MNKIYLGFGEKELKRHGLSPTPANWENGLRLNPHRRSFERWFAEAQFADGTRISAVFATKPRPYTGAPANPTVSIHISRPDGSGLHRSFSEGYGKTISASREYCNVNVSGSYLRQSSDGNYILYYVDDELEYSATFTPTLPMWRPGSGHIGTDSKWISWLVAVPCAKVTATMRWLGHTYTAHGSGYIDHIWGNIDAHILADHFYLCRCDLCGYTAICSDFVLADGLSSDSSEHISLMYLAKDGHVLCDGSEKCSVERRETFVHPDSKRFFDSCFDFSCQCGDGTIYTVSHEYAKDIEHQAPVTLLSRLFRLLGKNHTQVTSLSTCTLRINSENENSRFNGSGIMEQMAFSPLPQARPGEYLGAQWPPENTCDPNRLDSQTATQNIQSITKNNDLPNSQNLISDMSHD